MNLKQAQRHLLRDAKYRQQYDKHKDGVELAMHIVAIRKELAISHLELCSELGISKFDISKFENLKGRVDPWVISIIVTRFKNELLKRGIKIEKWIVAQPHSKEILSKSYKRIEATGRPIPNVQTTRLSRSTDLSIERRKLKSQEDKGKEV